MKNIVFEIHSNQSPDRLDKLIFAENTGLSRRHIKRLIDQGSVFADRRRIRRASQQIFPPVRIEIRIKDDQKLQEKAHRIHWPDLIIYRDEHLLAINKPAGIPTAPTLDSAVNNIYYFLEKAKLLPRNFFPFHRLDTETSGALLIPLSASMARELNRQMREQQIQKSYLAICQGKVPQTSWVVSGTIRKMPGGHSFYRFSSKPEPHTGNSRSDFQLLAEHINPNISLVLAKPITGRTHQIRLHLLSSNVPVLGDTRYNPNPGPALPGPLRPPSHALLHCLKMTFYHPFIKDQIAITALLPVDFLAYLHTLFPSYSTNSVTN